MNSVNIIGNITADPELKSYGKGKDAGSVVNFTLAVRRNAEDTDYIRCTAFGKTAELVDHYFGKGTKMGVTGRIQTGSYTDKDGNKRYTTDVIVSEVSFCEKAEASQDDDDEEDLPFNDKKKKSRR